MQDLNKQRVNYTYIPVDKPLGPQGSQVGKVNTEPPPGLADPGVDLGEVPWRMAEITIKDCLLSNRICQNMVVLSVLSIQSVALESNAKVGLACLPNWQPETLESWTYDQG